MGLTWLCEIDLALLCKKGLVEDIIWILMTVSWNPIAFANITELVSTSAGNMVFSFKFINQSLAIWASPVIKDFFEQC